MVLKRVGPYCKAPVTCGYYYNRFEGKTGLERRGGDTKSIPCLASCDKQLRGPTNL